MLEELNVIDEHSQGENKNQGRSCNNMRRRFETCSANSTHYKILFQILQGASQGDIEGTYPMLHKLVFVQCLTYETSIGGESIGWSQRG